MDGMVGDSEVGYESQLNRLVVWHKSGLPDFKELG